jgi:hypothetical protein
VLRVYHLAESRNYVESMQSKLFPKLSLLKVAEFLRRRTEMDVTSLVRAFRQWGREQVVKQRSSS